MKTISLFSLLFLLAGIITPETKDINALLNKAIPATPLKETKQENPLAPTHTKSPPTNSTAEKKLYNEIMNLPKQGFFEGRKIFGEKTRAGLKALYIIQRVFDAGDKIVNSINIIDQEMYNFSYVPGPSPLSIIVKQLLIPIVGTISLYPFISQELNGRSVSGNLKYINGNLFPKNCNKEDLEKEFLTYKQLLRKLLASEEKFSDEEKQLTKSVIKKLAFLSTPIQGTNNTKNPTVDTALLKKIYNEIKDLPQSSLFQGRSIFKGFSRLTLPYYSMIVLKNILEVAPIPICLLATYHSKETTNNAMLIAGSGIITFSNLNFLCTILIAPINFITEGFLSRTLSGNLKYINGNLIEEDGKVFLTEDQVAEYKTLLRKILTHEKAFSSEEKELCKHIIYKLSLVTIRQ